MLKNLSKIILLLVIALFYTQNCYSKLSDKQIVKTCQKMDMIMKEGIRKLNIPGAIYAVARHDKIIHKAAFGKITTDPNSENVTEHTIFPISSLSKNVTAILVGALIDDGKINFDDKVRKYWPEFFIGNEEISKKITIRDLISHRSGFKSFTAESLFSADYDNEKILNALKILKPKLGKFRKEYGYQNIIFGIVEKVLEKAMGQKYEDLIKKYIFNKMDLKESSVIPLKYETSFFSYAAYRLSNFGDDINRQGLLSAIVNFFKDIFSHKIKFITINHSRYNDVIYPVEQNDFFQKFAATSGISMSANDLAKWIQMIANRGKFGNQKIVSEKVFNELTSNMVTIDNLKDDDITFCKNRFERTNLYYGSGIFSAQYSDSGKNGRQILFHMGGTCGCSQFFAYSPKDDISVGVICNLGGVSHTLFSEYMALQFLDLCFEFSKTDWIQLDIDRKQQTEQKNKDFRNFLQQNISPMEDINKYIGTYSCELYGDIKIINENDSLILDNGIRKVKLKHLTGNIFEFPSKDLFISFFDTDVYAVFYKNKYGNFDSLRITCFHENESVFQKK